jgi:flagellar biosynthesis/type III secretory pathway M-ring protein FliF/YscJ
MHQAFAALLSAAATATPGPTTGPDPDLVTPGPWGFVAIAFLAAAVVFLIWDMMRRIRRARIRSEVGEQLDAEEAAARQAEGAQRATETDDEDIDPAR